MPTPTGGAGLLVGTALAIKTPSPACKVVGVGPVVCDPLSATFAAGEPVRLVE